MSSIDDTRTRRRRSDRYLAVTCAVTTACMLVVYAIAKPASAALPGQKWGQQIELGTVGNSTVWKVTDEALTCVVAQSRTNSALVLLGCWGAP